LHAHQGRSESGEIGPLIHPLRQVLGAIAQLQLGGGLEDPTVGKRIEFFPDGVGPTLVSPAAI